MHQVTCDDIIRTRFALHVSVPLRSDAFPAVSITEQVCFHTVCTFRPKRLFARTSIFTLYVYMTLSRFVFMQMLFYPAQPPPSSLVSLVSMLQESKRGTQ